MKKELIEKVLITKELNLKKEDLRFLLEGKLRAEINRLKDIECPQELKGMLMFFNIWNIKRPDRRFGVQHPGQVPGQIMINIIYHYLNRDKKHIIIDPMAGGGSTHDVCDFMNNLITEKQGKFNHDLICYSFDLIPKRDFIIEKNILEEDWNIQDVDLVFLDPPYFSMMKDDYTENKFTENRESFYDAMEITIKKSFDVLKMGGLCALIMEPQTEKDLEPGEVCIDLPFECYKIMEKIGFKSYQRIQIPLSTEQFPGSTVARKKLYKNKEQLMGIARDLIIMKKP